MNKKRKSKLRIPLKFDEAVADFLKVRVDKKKRGHGDVKPRTKSPSGGARSLAPRNGQESLKSVVLD
jgi:hypothetical protein